MRITTVVKAIVYKFGIFFAVTFLGFAVFMTMQAIIPDSAKLLITIALLVGGVVFIRKPISYGWLRHRAFYLGILFALPALWAKSENVTQQSPKQGGMIAQTQKDNHDNEKLSNSPQKDVKTKNETSVQKKPEQQETSDNELNLKKELWIIKGKEMVSSLLKDSDSAQFRHVFFSDKEVPIVCGEVNSKNSFGGYAGYQKFLTGNRPDLTFFQTDMKPTEFVEVWNRLCAN